MSIRPVYLPILPSMRGFFSEVDKGAKQAGTSAGRALSENLEREVRRSQGAVDKATEAVVRARERQEQAAATVRVAELRLQEVQASGRAKASQVAQAEAAVAKARDNQAAASRGAERADQKLADAKDVLARRSGEAAHAMQLSGRELDKLAEGLDRASGKADGFGSKLVGALGEVGRGALLGVGAKISTGIMGSIQSGFEGGFARLQNLEQAELMLSSLGHSGERLETIMTNATEAVTGTAYGMGDAMKLAANMVAAGVEPGEDLQRVLSLVSDSAAITGSELSDMGAIWAKVAAGGRMSTEEMNQLMDRGLGLLPALAQEYGVTNEEMRKLISEGQVGFEDFARVMESTVGGAAADMGESFSASYANFKASLGRMGAALLDPVFSAAPPIFQAMTEGVNAVKEKLDPLIAQWGEHLTPGLQNFAESLGPAIVTAVDMIATGIGVAVDAGQRMTEWLKNYGGLVATVAAPVMVLVGAYQLLALQQSIMVAGGLLPWFVNLSRVAVAHAAVMRVATGVQAAFNLVMNANPIFLIVTALTAVVAAIVVWVRHTESGQRAWEAFSGAIAGAYNRLIKPVIEGFGQLVRTLWDVWIKPAIEAAQGGWGSLATYIIDRYKQMFAVVFSPFQAVLGALQDRFAVVVDAIVLRWNVFRDGLVAVFTALKNRVFEPMQAAVGMVKSAFEQAVDAIGAAWGKLVDLTRRPVEFVVNAVYNNGIRRAWNAVSALVGLESLPEMRFARGGILPGYTPGRDPYTFIEPRTGMRIGLSGGEAILRPEATRVLGSGWVDGINAAARMGGRKAVASFLGGFAGGGVVPSIINAVKKIAPGMTITSTVRPGDPGYHGRGMAVDASDGTDTTPAMQKVARAFYTNYGKGLAELIHWPLNGWQNLKHGRPLNYGEPTNSQHRNHVHIASTVPLGDPGGMVDQAWEGARNFFQSMRERVLGIFDRILDPVRSRIPAFGGLIGKLPGAFLSKMGDAVRAFLGMRSDSYAPEGGSAGSAQSWRGMAMAAMRRNGFNADDPAQVNAMLAQIMSESGGDPNIAQQIVDINGTGESAGVGLLQIIPGTFARYRDPELPDDRRDPWANMNAALRYYRARYGGDLTTMWGKGHGYADGGIIPSFTGLFDRGGWLPSGGVAVNLSGKPEPVFTGPQWDLIRRMVTQLGELVPVIGRQAGALEKITTPSGGFGVGAFLQSARPSELIGLAQRLPMVGDLAGMFSGVANGLDDVTEAYAAQESAAAAVAEKSRVLEEAHRELREAHAKAGVSEDERAELVRAAQEKITAAESELSDARAAAASAARAIGQAHIAMAIEVVSLLLNIFDRITTSFFAAQSAVMSGIGEMMGSIRELAGMIDRQRQAVVGLSLDFVRAQIDVTAAARESRFTQINGALATLEAVKSVADAQAAFDAQRRADARAALNSYEDLTLAADRFRWMVRGVSGAAIDDMTQWSDKTKALWAELQAAQHNQRVQELAAQKANLVAAYQQTLAVLDLRAVTENLQVASQKLALMSGQAFGFNQLGATVGQRYAALTEELARIESQKWSWKTWLNPANWFNGYYGNANRRQEQIRKELKELEAREEFQGLGISQGEINRLISGAGWMGLFGGSDQISDYIRNSAIGDAARALDKLKFEESLIDIKAGENSYRLQIEKMLEELKHRNELEPLENLIKASELERDAQLKWAEYYRESNETIKGALENSARYLQDSAVQLKEIASRPNTLVFNIPAGADAVSVRDLEEIERRLREENAALQMRIERIERPAVGAAEVSDAVRSF